MFVRNRFLAGASAVALAAGTTFAGAGIASAQDDESTGSLGSSSINLGEIAGDLETAAEALSGPVTVVANHEGGPTVTYSNQSDVDQRCLGTTAPYSTIEDNDLETDYPEGDLAAGIALITAIEAGGGLTHLLADAEGAPTVELDDPAVENNVVQNVLPLAFGQPGRSVLVEAGTDVTWTALSPETPAVGIVLCVPVNEDGTLGGLITNFGIDPQVVADQINGRVPGGSVEPVSAGSISGGSVEMGANVLGSLAAASSEDGEGEGSSFMSSGFSEAGSGGDDTDDLPPLEPAE
ncbi:hypothetical protein SAMN06265174_10368 [Dietzia kunjamensis subsp. schimae]|uniref:Uncharacterized protein n=1 Tax=Dietzia kunjamensis subsp. schimae TaxID=498198 RepID=A0ABY1N198_9ACTN|nr:hypothetical protein [Dietzia kunjamensis]MBB1013731.1 hypothetical protein [Dietzia kunjamensis subsp. schimae]SMO64315.1 hypothetical protein SAMN06265174_10368 [Dietzia kunjamensis subsp. schimae]